MTVAGDRAASGRAAPVPGPRAAIARELVAAALEADDAVLGAWEAGSAAFGRADDASDLDVVVVCRDGEAERILDAIETRLENVADGLDALRVGRSAFGFQRFWKPRGKSDAVPCMVDASVIDHDGQRAEWQELLLPERHGGAIVLYDGGIVEAARAAATFDPDEHRRRLGLELDSIRERHAMFADFPEKEAARGRSIDAFAFHQSMLVRPLVALLGMVHRPLRWDFGMRYLHAELPPDVVECLEPIVRGGHESQAREWIDRLLAQVDPEALPIEAHARQMREAFG